MGTVVNRWLARPVAGFLARALLLGLAVAASHVAISMWPVDQGGYLAAVIDKQARLAGTPPPRLVLVGGSNLSFSVDSPELERELGRPVVNMGLGIYAGLRFMLDSVAPGLGEGDLVVVSPEYQLFYGLYDGDDELLDVLEAWPKGFRYVRSPRQLWIVARRLPVHAKRKFNRVLEGWFRAPNAECVYCRRAFNEYGDLTAHLSQDSKDISDMVIFRARREHGGIQGEAIAGLDRFVARAAAKGARVVLIWPGVPEKQFAENRERIEKLDAAIRADGAIRVLGRPEDNVYPTELFFDWVYHMNSQGRVRRTADIVRRLKEDGLG